jgi:RecA/RadA recombinase
MNKKYTNNFLKDLIFAIQDENTSLAADAVSSAEYTGFIDTGSYIFNAQLSGSLYGGFPNTKILCLAGEEAVGKTFFALGIVKNFLQNPDAQAVWYLAETAVPKKMLEERGIDSSRVMYAEPLTVFEWRHHVVKVLDAYMETTKPPMIMALDSLGALSTEKELEDSAKGDYKRDMTRQQHIRGTFRIIDKKLARAKVPMIVTNHTYEVVGAYVPTKAISGGGGIKYAGDLISILSKSKDRDEDKEVVGTIVKSYMYKNRIAKEYTTVELKLSYQTGVDRHYGLLDLGEKHGVFKKVANKWEMPDASKHYQKAIYSDPEKFFNREIMDRLEAAAHTEFEYGKSNNGITGDNFTEFNTERVLLSEGSAISKN